jgi:tetratricopeptide (TPR) repeat protein
LIPFLAGGKPLTLKMLIAMRQWISGMMMLLICAASVPAQGQIRTPAASPLAKVEQRVGLTDMSVSYYRPSAKGRQVFGKLVPYGEIWRTGANGGTRISFSDPVKVEGKEVPKGEYALYSIPGEKEWILMLYKDLNLGGNVGDYKAENELIRFTVPAAKLPMKMESFTVLFGDLSDNSAQLYLMWEETMVKVKIEVTFHDRVMADIERVMKGPSANDYSAAAGYYYANNLDMNQALAWINKALEGNERYWLLTTKARIQTRLKDYKGAMATSQRALELAKEQGDNAYVLQNTELQAEIKKMM